MWGVEMKKRSPAGFLVAVVLLSLGLVGCNGGDGGDSDDPTPTASGAITIDAPAAGTVVQVPFTIAGTADVFEGALVVQAFTGSGEVLCERRVQAVSGSGTRGTWEAVLAFAPSAGREEITLKAFSVSPQDGQQEHVVFQKATVDPDVPPIVIESPGCGEESFAESILTVSGTASVFEAALIVELRQADGTVLQTKAVTASAAGPERGTWQTSLDVLSARAGLYEVVAYSLSARDGTPEHIFSVPIRRNP